MCEIGIGKRVEWVLGVSEQRYLVMGPLVDVVQVLDAYDLSLGDDLLFVGGNFLPGDLKVSFYFLNT
jgi:hypothetical protein